MKTCTKCNIEKNYKDFEFERNTCKSCRNEQKKLRPKIHHDVTVNEKCCTKCKIIKPADNFNLNARVLDGLSIYCTICTTEKSRRDYEKRSETIRANAALQYQKVRGTEEYRAKARDRQNARLKVDPKYKLKRNLRNRLYYALQKTQWKKNTKFTSYIGCSLEELKSHLEKQFTIGMSWDNYGEWHVDHIMPLDSAETEEQLYTLCHFTNLQPLWGEDNWSKGAKIK
jgi:hypothetical protein